MLIAACLIHFAHYDKIFTGKVLKTEAGTYLLSTAALQEPGEDIEQIRVPSEDCVTRELIQIKKREPLK